MEMLFVMDPIGSINIKKDTTFAFMLEAQRRGWGVSWCTAGELGADARGGWAVCSKVRVERVVGEHYSERERAKRPLSDFRVVWMRTDPPFTMDYYYATLLLDLVDPSRTLVLNRPAGLRAANEKAFILQFPSAMPPSIVTRSRAEIREFLASVGGVGVIKPLDRMGGSGIFVLRDGDPNLASILETSTANERELVMVQQYLPKASEGDKRVLLLDGEPLGAILRVPQGSDFRGNMAVGGQAVAVDVTDRDREIIAVVRDRLRAAGLYFVGLDVIGGYLTELNVTSPTGVQEINRLHGLAIEQRVFDWVDARVAS
ncbi:MAG: glutathione synthase [Myxococcales bacterium]|nr:glutathione synthase [Myxococcales bacterium]MCB9530717.1 glutathione synthase [Myxococcales bacterium]MCB9533389.1 glutathione synthase [Myxococcales bacterium]